jgi:hypothetical protein
MSFPVLKTFSTIRGWKLSCSSPCVPIYDVIKTQWFSQRHWT